MPNPTPTKTEAAPQPSTEDRLLKAMEMLAQSNAAIVANTPIHNLSFAEWLEKNPEPKLPFPLVLNARRVSADQVTAEQIALLPGLKEGRFFGRRIHVYRDQSPDRVWHIKWPGKALSDRMEMSTYGRDFTEILKRLTTEEPDNT